MDKETLDLLLKNYKQLDKVTLAQLSTIVAAVEAYDFPADARGEGGERWRENFLAAVRAGELSNTTGLLIVVLSEEVKIEACS